ncbi:MAG: protein kinase domain-containing protein, partial [Terriglobales bacterium]
PYRITAKLGEGGMGAVWRATDTRLQREVAVKVVLAQFSGRFEREARAIGALNHPNICSLYDVGPSFLVMELVEGPTLAGRIAGGRLPLEEALPLALQIAEGLEFAHEHGIVHRDLKPANIKITPEGRIKILDFGLARALSTESSASLAAEAPTQTTPPTLAGTMLGTAAYMAPEQARGQPADRRADIWAFGVVLYEMLIGERPFAGPTLSDTLAAVLRAEPDFEGLPLVARAVIEGCLRKHARERWQAIGDVRLALAGTLPTWQGAAAAPPPRAAPGRRRPQLLAAGAAVVLLAAAGAAAYFRPAPPPAPLIRFAITPPDNTRVASFSAPAISPDGSTIAFAAVGADHVPRIYLRRLDGAAAEPLSGTGGASQPFWSPDSHSLGFWKDGNLEKMDLAGGPPVPLAAAAHMQGASWGSGGVIVFAPTGSGPLYKIPADGGAAVPVTVLDRSHAEISDDWPAFLPDGRHFLYLTHPAALVGTICIGSLDRTPARRLIRSTSNPLYASGNLLFISGGSTLMAQPFDLAHQALTGQMVSVATVSHSGPLGYFTASSSGILAYQSADLSQLSVAWYDRGGHRLGAAGAPGQHLGLTLSPNGKSAIVTEIDGGRQAMDLWRYDLSRNVRVPFLLDFSMTMDGVWSPDGRQIAFSGARQSIKGDLYREPADDVGAPELLYSDNDFKVPTSWSPDGKYLLYESELRGESDVVWALPLTGARKPFQAAHGREGTFSPDGHWVAYQSEETGRDEVYLTPFPGPGPRWLVSTAGGEYPRWRADGKELYYVSPDNQLMAATVDSSATPPRVGAAQALFSPAAGVIAGQPPFAAAADGQRFLVITTASPIGPQALNVVVNWRPATKH